MNGSLFYSYHIRKITNHYEKAEIPCKIGTFSLLSQTAENKKL